MSEEQQNIAETESAAEDVLSDEILADAKKRVDRTVKRAEREGKKFVDRAVAEAEAVRERVLEHADAQVARDKRVFDSGIALEERMRRLKAQGALIDEAMDAALAKLRTREGLDYPQVLVKLAAEAVLAMSEGAFVLRLAARDVETMKHDDVTVRVSASVKEASSRDVTLSIETARAPIHGGVIVETADGTRRVNNSFAGRLDRMKDDLRFNVANVLFGDQL